MIGAPPTLACKVRRVIAKHVNRDPSTITDEAWLYELGVCDLVKIEIGLDIEDMLDAEASDTEHEACRQVSDLIALAERLAAGEREIAA